jgi:hypothetical protein
VNATQLVDRLRRLRERTLEITEQLAAASPLTVCAWWLRWHSRSW